MAAAPETTTLALLNPNFFFKTFLIRLETIVWIIGNQVFLIKFGKNCTLKFCINSRNPKNTLGWIS